jgi:hypothetical protein
VRWSRATVLAWSLFALTVIAAAGCIALTLADAPISDSSTTMLALDFHGIPFALSGALIASHCPRHRTGWLFIAYGLIFVWSETLNSYAIHALVVAPDSWPLPVLAAWLGGLLVTLSFNIVFPLLFMLFPDGHLRERSQRIRGGAILGVGLLTLCVIVFGRYEIVSGAVTPVALGVTNPSGFFSVSFPGQAVGLTMLHPAALAVCLLIAVWGMSWRLRQARGVERERLKWLALVVGLLVVCAAGAPLPAPIGLMMINAGLALLILGVPVTVAS